MDKILENKIRETIEILLFLKSKGVMTIEYAYDLGMLEGILLFRNAEEKQLEGQVDFIKDKAQRIYERIFT